MLLLTFSFEEMQSRPEAVRQMSVVAQQERGRWVWGIVRLVEVECRTCAAVTMVKTM